jgi:aspartate aminotransferase
VIKKAKEMNLDFIEPDGAMYVFAKVRENDFDGTEFSLNLLNYGLAVAPGEGFGDYKSFIRISACQDKNKLMEGMNILDNLLRGKK